MRSPRMVAGPVLPPGKCFICGGAEGAMVDTMVDIVGDGRFYICERICLPLIAAAAGWGDPQFKVDVESEKDALRQENEYLRVELEAERQDKVVKVSDLADYLKRQQKAKAGPAKVTAPA